MVDRTVSVNLYLEINNFLAVSSWFLGQSIPLSVNSINDIRQIESILQEISLRSTSESDSNSPSYHIPLAKKQINNVINDLALNDGPTCNSSDLAKLQFILCQRYNIFIPKNRRRYNLITQIMSIKTHLISPTCYIYFQSLECTTLLYVHKLDKLYSSFGLENDFCTYLTQATSCFSSKEKNVIVQMDQIHVKSDIAYKVGGIFAPNLNAEDPTRTKFAIMVFSLYKLWSCIIRLLPCASISAEKIFPTINSSIIEIEHCGLEVQIISTDNYPLNLNLFKDFSLSGKLETKVHHPFDENIPLLLKFHFLHILKSIRHWFPTFLCWRHPFTTYSFQRHPESEFDADRLILVSELKEL